MNSITVCSNDKLNYTPESGFTYTDSYGEKFNFSTADDFREWFASESGGMDLGEDVEEFLNDCSFEKINIADINSAGITYEMKQCGATEATLLGSGESEDGDMNSMCTFYAIINPQTGFEFRVASTNGDPVWEEQDPSVFAELAQLCGVNI